MDLAYLRKLIKILDQSTMTEMEIEEEGIKLRLAKQTNNKAEGQHGHIMPYYQMPAPMPQQQQQQLFQPNPLAVLTIRLQQEIHRRPRHTPVAHHVDQMDQQRQQNQEETPRQWLMNELHKHYGR